MSDINLQQCKDEPQVVLEKKSEFCRRIRSLTNKAKQETTLLQSFQDYRTALVSSGKASPEKLHQVQMDIAFLKYLINQTCNKLDSYCHKWQVSKNNMAAQKERLDALNASQLHR